MSTTRPSPNDAREIQTMIRRLRKMRDAHCGLRICLFCAEVAQIAALMEDAIRSELHSTCAHCGVWFVPSGRYVQRHCGAICREAWKYARKKAARAAARKEATDAA